MATVHAFDVLEEGLQSEPADCRVCVLFGDEPFLKRLARRRLVEVLGGNNDGDDLPVTLFEGKGLPWRDVRDELSTASLFGTGPRIALVDDADEFVSKNRQTLEKYVAKPADSGVLILSVGTWAANTKLYKAVDQSGVQIECRAPVRGRAKSIDTKKLAQWINSWAQAEHGIKCSSDAVDEMLRLVGPELGILDNELAKLALLVPTEGKAKNKVDADLVRAAVGGGRAESTWKMIDHMLTGNAAEALRQLDLMIQGGEEPHAVFGQVAWSLRRFAAATRNFQRSRRAGKKPNVKGALIAAGFPKGGPMLENAMKQLQQVGRARGAKLYEKLLAADLALKGTHSHRDRARLILEDLIIFLAA